MNSKEGSSTGKFSETRGVRRTGMAVTPRDLKALRLPLNPHDSEAVTRREIEAGDILLVHLTAGKGEGEEIVVVVAPYMDKKGHLVMDVRPIPGVEESTRIVRLADLGIVPYQDGESLVWSSTVYVTKPQPGRD